MRWGWWLAAMVGLLCGMGSCFLLVRSSPKLESVPTGAAALRTIRLEMFATGEVVPARNSQIKSEVTALVADVPVKIGQFVTNNQVLVELERRELRAQLDEAMHRIEAAQLRMKKSQLDLSRKRQLFDKRLVPEQDFDSAEIDAALARNELDIQRAHVDSIQQQLARTTIRAPHDGMVLNVRARKGTVIMGGPTAGEATVLMEIADLGSLAVEASINEIDVTRLVPGSPVRLAFDSLPGITTTGMLEFVSPSATKKKEDDAARTFPITVAFQAFDRRIRPGISSRLTVALDTVSNAISVPVTAVFAEGPTNFVYVQGGPAFERRLVRIGISDRQFLEVQQGIAAGDSVALARPAPELLKPGNIPTPK